MLVSNLGRLCKMVHLSNSRARLALEISNNEIMAYAACHLERLLTDVRHNFVDRPIELLRHQSAGCSNRCMKPVQSLF